MSNVSDDRRPPQNPIDKIWTELRSMRFALWLVVLLAIASLGNLFGNEFIVPVDGGSAEAREVSRQAYGEPRASILMGLQMYSPYRSWWYTSLLSLLLLSLLACTIDRTPGVFRAVFRPRFLTDLRSYEAMDFKGSKIGGSQLLPQLVAALKRAGYRVWHSPENSITYVYGSRFAIARLGPWLVHLGFIFLLVGGAMIARGSYSTYVDGRPGDLLASDESLWGFNVRVDDFRVDYHPLDLRQIVEVDNHIIGRILSRAGTERFNVEALQPSLGLLRDVKSDRISNKIERRMGGGRLDKANIADYVATLTVVERGESLFTRTVEVNAPLRHKGYRFYQSSYDDRRTDSDGRWTTILQVRKDTGSPLVWAGLVAVSLGLVLGLYFSPRHVYARVQIASGKTEVHIAGRAARNAGSFADEFAHLISKIGNRE
jgi:cytochrome c biogenesis protein